MKSLLKSIARFFSKLAVFPFVFFYKVCSLTKQKDALFCAIGQLLALVPGKTGSYLRVAFYSSILQNVSTQIHIDFGSYFSHPDVEIGQKVYIGAYCIIGKCTIGQQTNIGSFVNILSGSRQHFFTDKDTPIQSQGGEFVRIHVGSDCWIGNNAVLMASIGNRSIIGAGSVVVKEIPAHSVAVGNPCAVIKRLQ